MNRALKIGSYFSLLHLFINAAEMGDGDLVKTNSVRIRSEFLLIFYGRDQSAQTLQFM